MAIIKVLLPQYGMGMQEGKIYAWHKKAGDRVTAGEVLVEVEAAKAMVEVPAPASGELLEITAKEGDTVEVRAVIAHLKLD